MDSLNRSDSRLNHYAIRSTRNSYINPLSTCNSAPCPSLSHNATHRHVKVFHVFSGFRSMWLFENPSKWGWDKLACCFPPFICCATKVGIFTSPFLQTQWWVQACSVMLITPKTGLFTELKACSDSQGCSLTFWSGIHKAPLFGPWTIILVFTAALATNWTIVQKSLWAFTSRSSYVGHTGGEKSIGRTLRAGRDRTSHTASHRAQWSHPSIHSDDDNMKTSYMAEQQVMMISHQSHFCLERYCLSTVYDGLTAQADTHIHTLWWWWWWWWWFTSIIITNCGPLPS